MRENTVGAFVEARLNPQSLAEAEVHLRTCAECHELVASALGAAHGTLPTWRLGPGSPPPSRSAVSNEPARVSGVLPPGTSVERFTVLGLVGRGGMGEVYAAYDPSLDRRVALKMVHGLAVAPDAHAHARMLREAQAIAKLSHPNVVVVYEVGTFEQKVFIAMEFVEGRTLAEWLADGGHSWRDIVGVFVQAARGLSAAHRAGFVHRDFKPQNVMVTGEGHVRVMDFGLARRIDSVAANEVSTSPALPSSPLDAAEGTLTRTGEQLGTPLFMAPEQFASGRVDARTDQFSFCVALFWALYGVHPFGAGQPSAASPPKTTNPPAWLRAAVRRGLRAAPEDRWPSMDELAAALARDPGLRSKRIAWGALAAGFVAAVGLGTYNLAARHRAVCQGGPSRMAGVWELAENAAPSGSRREAIQTAILRSGVSGAEKIWDSVARMLDRHAAGWLTAYRDTCEATHGRGEQSVEVLDLRMECLTDNLDSVRALTDLLARGARGVVENAVKVTASLDDYERCSNIAQLRLGVQPPKDPMIRGEVAELRRKLKSADALIGAGQEIDGTAMAKPLLARAEEVGYCPLVAEALAIIGDGEARRDPMVAAKLMERALVTGESCGADRVVARAAIGTITVYWFRDWKMAERSAALGKATLERIGGDPRLESWLANNMAGLRYKQNRLAESLEELERSMRLKQAFLGKEHVDYAGTQSNASLIYAKLGRLDEALAASEHVLRVFSAWIPATSYWYSNALDNHAFILWRLGRLDEAESYAQRVLSEAQVDPYQNVAFASATRTVGLVALDRGQTAKAVHYLERAIQLLEAAQESFFEVAEAQFALARALDQPGQNRDRSAQLVHQALATFSSEQAFAREKKDVEGWIGRRQHLASKRRALR